MVAPSTTTLNASSSSNTCMSICENPNRYGSFCLQIKNRVRVPDPVAEGRCPCSESSPASVVSTCSRVPG